MPTHRIDIYDVMDFIVASAAKYSYALQEHTPMLATCHSPLSGSGSGSGTETVKRPSAVQDVNFAAKRDAQRAGGGEVSREGEREREAGSGERREGKGHECRRVACY